MDMFEFQHNGPLDPSALVDLFARMGWQETEAGSKIEWIIAASDEWVTCTVNGELVGFGRTCRLDPLHRLLFDVVVDSRYDGLGVDDEIVRQLAGDVRWMQEIDMFRHEFVGAEDLESPVASLFYHMFPEAPPDAYLG